MAEITRFVKGRTLLVGRKIGQEKFNMLGASLRVEAKPHKYPTGKNVVAWEKQLLSRFAEGDFNSIILHRFLYKPVKEYVEDPNELLTEVKRILPEGGVVVVNSFLLDERTKNFRSAESFYAEEDMKRVLQKQFKNILNVKAGDALIFVCEK